MRAPRSVTFAPIGTPSRSLKLAIDFLARVTTVLWKSSFSRGLVSPVPLGRPLATAAAGAAAAAPFFGCWALGAGRAAGVFCVVGSADSFAMVSAPVDRFAAALADADLAPVAEHLDPAARGLVATAAHHQHVGEGQRALALDDAALPQLLRRPLVLLHHVELLDQHPPGGRQHPQHLPALAALPTGNDRHRVAASHVHLKHQMTSGASEMILVNCRSRSSRATGPKMRVPTGFSSGLIRTTALRSKRMYDPSRRRTSLTVRTTTARATSPFFTVPSGTASLMATMTVSPSEA